MITDKSDNIWISGDDGVLKVKINSNADSLNYVKYSLEEMKITYGNIVEIYSDSKDRIWAAGLKGELSYFDGNTWIEVPIPEEMLGVKNEYGNFFIKSIVENNSGEMIFFWWCADFYLSYDSAGILKKIMYPNDFFDDDLNVGIIYDAKVGNDGSILLGTDGNSFVKFTKSTYVESETTEKLTISPNPADNFITIFNQPYEGFKPTEGFEIQIFNVIGEKVLSIHVDTDKSERINISNLEAGIYFVKSGHLINKFVKK